jgi:uncharacterized membrane protein
MGHPKIGKSRLEAFSDGVLAVIITIMVLELKVPHGDSIEGLVKLYPIFLSYVLSFVYISIYWNNHHHMLHTTKSVSGVVLWANLHLLFWLSLVPFATGWMSENHFSTLPVQLYGAVLFMSGLAYWLLQRAIIHAHADDDVLRQAIGTDWKGKLSPVLYLIAIVAAFWASWPAITIYTIVALLWFVPDPRIEKMYHI